MRFALTGGAATLVHLAVAMALIRFGVPPLIGNAVAFVMAFVVSFCGHHLFTFAGHGAVATAFQRFAIVAGFGFLANETVLFAFLASGAVSPGAAVLLSTAFAAMCNFVLSRHWAFAASARAQ